MNLTLYNDLKDAKMVENAWDDMGPEEQSAAVELLIQNAMASAQKISGMCGYRQNRKAFIEFCAGEIDRIKAQMKRAQAIDDRMESSILTYMQGKGVDKIEAGTFTLSIKRNPPSVVITDESAIPSQYIRVKTEPIKADIAKALKAGEEVPGARMETERVSLVVK